MEQRKKKQQNLENPSVLCRRNTGLINSIPVNSDIFIDRTKFVLVSKYLTYIVYVTSVSVAPCQTPRRVKLQIFRVAVTSTLEILNCNSDLPGFNSL